MVSCMDAMEKDSKETMQWVVSILSKKVPTNFAAGKFLPTIALTLASELHKIEV